jgi:hypothetical protein
MARGTREPAAAAASAPDDEQAYRGGSVGVMRRVWDVVPRDSALRPVHTLRAGRRVPCGVFAIRAMGTSAHLILPMITQTFRFPCLPVNS